MEYVAVLFEGEETDRNTILDILSSNNYQGKLKETTSNEPYFIYECTEGRRQFENTYRKDFENCGKNVKFIYCEDIEKLITFLSRSCKV